MQIMKAMNSNQNSASANLLNSLKPFLRDSKKDKVDQYIKFIKISNILNGFNNNSGGDEK